MPEPKDTTKTEHFKGFTNTALRTVAWFATGMRSDFLEHQCSLPWLTLKIFRHMYWASPTFRNNLRQARAEVATWPEWKRRAL